MSAKCIRFLDMPGFSEGGENTEVHAWCLQQRVWGTDP